MRIVNITIPVEAPAGRVWEVLADFGGFLKWAGGDQDEITNEGEGIGMVRHLRMGGNELAERLTLLDHTERKLGYDLVYGEPIGMKQYDALVQVVARDSGCDLVWRGTFENGDPATEQEVAEALTAAYQGMSQALAAVSDTWPNSSGT